MSLSPSGVTGSLFQIKRFSIHDGPGIRTTVFFKGCPLSCAWCHNPESQQSAPELMVFPFRCISCGSCSEACPSGAVTGCTETDRSLCTGCGECALVCHPGARMIAGVEMTVEEVMREVLRDLPFYRNSGGGVTFSGGEPLSQPVFLEKLLIECRERCLHTCVDTSGYCDWDCLERVAPLTDLFLYDLKVMDCGTHLDCTGVSSDLILENLGKLSSIHGGILVRTALIPGRTDSGENVRATREFASALPGSPAVEFLPYHDSWRAKLYRLGREA